MPNNTFKIGDLVEDIYGMFIEGTIVEIDGDSIYVEFINSVGGGRLPFESNELIKLN